MPATVLVSPGERPVIGFALSRVGAFYQKGTTEQRESAQSLLRMLEGLESAPDGAAEIEFLIQDAYLLGVRLFFTSVELEDYWLDTRERGRGRAIADPDPALQMTVERYFPRLVADPGGWNFDDVRGVFTDLGFRLDRAVTEASPRARAMYNGDRDEMTSKAIADRERNAELRASAAVAEPAPGPGVAATAVGVRAPVHEWGVEVATGLSPDDIPTESYRALTLGSVRVLITNFGGQLAAVSGSCTHQAASLAKARTRGPVIQCPRHGAEFDLRSGSEVCPPFCDRWMEANGMKAQILKLVTPDKKGGDLPTFPLKVEDGQIILRV